MAKAVTVVTLTSRLKEADCDPVVGIVSRALQRRGCFPSPNDTGKCGLRAAVLPTFNYAVALT